MQLVNFAHKAPLGAFCVSGVTELANAKIISFVDHEIRAATIEQSHALNALVEECIALRVEVEQLRSDLDQLKQGGDPPKASA